VSIVGRGDSPDAESGPGPGTEPGASRDGRAGVPVRPVALALVGPTAVGKTELALRIAERLGGEIVSMDSRQVYRGLDIGTAKPTGEQCRRVPHHGLDLVEPGERFSAGRFAREARRWIAGIRARGKVPILEGGTGFFLRALMEPLFDEPPMPVAARERLRVYLADRPAAELRRWLDVLDPKSAGALGRGGGRQRMARALEVVLLTGRPLPWWQRHRPPAVKGLPVMVFVLSLPRDRLYARINARVRAMLDAGLLDEVRELLHSGHHPHEPGMSAVGYAEMAACLRGELALEDAVDAVQRATRRYARRQLTWFRNQLPDSAVWLDGMRPADDLVEEVLERWRATG
jgi:tRNA dimethylallyltransferase